jgi:O-antigen ligase
MPKPRSQRQPERTDPFRDPAEMHWSQWLTRVALVLTAAVVFARATTLETLRNPLEVLPGSPALPRGTGAAEGLWLDLIACLPALLVLARRAIDPSATLRLVWSAVPMLLLGAWAVASTLWSADRFAALVSACHLLAAFVLLWSTAQLVTSWLRLRFVAAVCFGLLLVMVGQTLYYRFVELPDFREAFRNNAAEMLKQSGTEPGSFGEEQFKQRVTAGQTQGFTASPNTFAAVIVLLSVVTGGLLAQRLARREEFGRDVAKGATLPAIFLAVALAGGAGALWFTGSRAAAANWALGLAAFAALAVAGRTLARYARRAYFVGVALATAGAAGVAAYGLSTGTLLHISLTFRWRYWVGAAGAFAAHPWLGVGYENFGLHYLAHRLPLAAEEVRDPHNFVVRFVTELGIVGGLLLLAWQLRLWWELTRPAPPPAPADSTIAATAAPRRPSAVAAAVAAGAAGAFFWVLAGLDFDADNALLQLLLLGGFFCVFVLGTTVGLVRAVEDAQPDARLAPWVLAGCVLAVGLFLLHNLVDFALFEPGPMLLFAMVAGAALGARAAGTATPPTMSRRLAAVAAAGAAVVWGGVALAVAVPVTRAEGLALLGDDAMRAERFGEAERRFSAAADVLPCNADYAFRAAVAAYWGGRADAADALVDRALAAHPLGVKYLLYRARANAAAPPGAVAPKWQQILSDFERALEIDPYNVPARLDYADALARTGDTASAKTQLQEALRIDDLLPGDEPKRLKKAAVDALRERIAKMGNP